MKIRALLMLSVIMAAVGTMARVDRYRVTITNLTRGQGWGLPLLVTHWPEVSIFEEGLMASRELEALAEDGDNIPLADLLLETDGVIDVVGGTAPIPPGASRSFDIRAYHGASLSALGMLGTTNDAFGAIKNISLSGWGGSYYGLAYDAGSEANNELCEFIPGLPCGSVGVRDTSDAEGYVYISNGIQGIGDLDRATFDWRNPVIRVDVERL